MREEFHLAFVLDVSGDVLSEDAVSEGEARVTRLAAMCGAARCIAADAAPSGVTVVLCDPNSSNNNNKSASRHRAALVPLTRDSDQTAAALTDLERLLDIVGPDGKPRTAPSPPAGAPLASALSLAAMTLQQGGRSGGGRKNTAGGAATGPYTITLTPLSAALT